MGLADGDRVKRGEIEEAVRALSGDIAALRGRLEDVDATREATERLSGELRRMAERLDAEFDKLGRLARDVLTLDRRADAGEEAVEAQRLKLTALAKQCEWEAESTRKSIQGMLEQYTVRSD